MEHRGWLAVLSCASYSKRQRSWSLPNLNHKVLGFLVALGTVLGTGEGLACPDSPVISSPVCLKSPDHSPGDIYLRDADGRRLNHNWPDRTPAVVLDYRSDCRYGSVRNSSGETAWVSLVVIRDASLCGPPIEVPPEDPPPNDSHDPSLPNDYYDYLPFYSDLSEQVGDCQQTNDCRQQLRYYSQRGADIGSYNWARETMFQEVDVMVMDTGQRAVQAVYTGKSFAVPSRGVPNHTVVNTEHTFPQSLLKSGSNYSKSRADLIHLFPTESRVNSTRGNQSFADCPEDGSAWRDCSQGFEPPDSHKGVVARVMFYMAVTYNLAIKASEEQVLRDWARQFPVTSEERLRAHKLYRFQGNRNPFVDHPEWIDLIANY